MDSGIRQLSLQERWEIDIKSYENGAKTVSSVPQCESCKNRVKGDALHCKVYHSERKPSFVLFPQKECPSYANINPLSVTMEDVRENRLYGGLFGFCIGDILGVPVEFSSRAERKADFVQEMRAYGTYHQPFGTWSDDTSLTLCLIDAINNGYDLYKVADNFMKFYKKGDFTPQGQVFDIGNSTRCAINRMEAGEEPVMCGGSSEGDNGNGSLMRALPLAFYGSGLGVDGRVRMIEEVSALTHAHKRSMLACVYYVQCAARLFAGDGKEEACRYAARFVKEHCKAAYENEFSHFQYILNNDIQDLEETQIKSSGYVIDSLEAALWVFLKSGSYQETVLRAVNLGGDTDTVAATAGGLAGTYYGFKEIPDRWIQNIIRKQDLYSMFRKFKDIAIGKATP